MVELILFRFIRGKSGLDEMPPPVVKPSVSCMDNVNTIITADMIATIPKTLNVLVIANMVLSTFKIFKLFALPLENSDIKGQKSNL